MIKSMECITASSVIRNSTVYRNGEVVFTTGAGAPAEFLLSVYQFLNLQYPKFYKMDSLSRLGWIASEVLLGEGWDRAAYKPEEVAIVLANASSSLDTDYKYIATTKDIPSPSVFVYTLPNIVMGEICIRNNFKGENAFFLSESFDAGLIWQYVSLLLGGGIARACIAGWVELLGEDYTAALFLVEQNSSSGAPIFSPENMNRIFNASTTGHAD